ncbi:MAG: ATP-binding protein [Actinomycetes bacterium]
MPAARRHVREALLEAGCDELLDVALLGVSEIVTNACLHARTPIALSITATDAGHVRIEVADADVRMPRQRELEPLADSGRGLRLLDACGAWGVSPTTTGAGKCVWFEPSVSVSEGVVSR